jgi:hypothetical protein
VYQQGCAINGSATFSSCRALQSITGKFMGELGWTECHLCSVPSSLISFPLLIIVIPLLTTHCHHPLQSAIIQAWVLTGYFLWWEWGTARKYLYKLTFKVFKTNGVNGHEYCHIKKI